MIASVLAAFACTGQTPPASEFEQVLTGHTHEQYIGDLAELKTKGVLRVLTRNNSSSYFISKGRQLGFEYELAKKFADSLGLRLAIVVPKSRSQLIPALLRGEGDLIAAGMTSNDARSKLVRFSKKVFDVRRVLVTHENIIKQVRTLNDLVQLEIALNHQSTTVDVAKHIGQDIGLDLRIQLVPPTVEMEEILRRVDSGDYESTIVDENILALEQSSGIKVVGRVPIGAPLVKSWAVRPKAIELAQAMDSFIGKEMKTGLIRILYQRYFSPQRRGFRKAKNFSFRADARGRISPYDHFFKKEGKARGIDWRLLAALAYAESRFNPKAKSAFGAAGLMQVLPSTARKHGGLKGDDEEVVRQLFHPATNIRIGVGYLAWLIERFENEAVAPRQSIRFALASYNVGLGHVKDARALARTRGLDENRWFQNVEKAIRLKKNPKWYRQTRYGYCRAEQPIAYVSRIQTRYDVYTRHVPFE